MIRRSLALALRSFARPQTLRFSFSFQSDLEGQTQPNQPRVGQAQGHESQSQFRGNSKRAPRQFNQSVFEGMAKYSNSDVLEFLFKQKGEETTEDFMYGFFDGLQTRDGFKGWQALSPEERLRFVKSFILLVEESSAVQSRFSTHIYGRILMRLIFSTSDSALALELLKSIIGSSRSGRVKFSIAGNFIQNGLERFRNRSDPSFKEGLRLCEQTMSDMIRESRVRVDTRTVDAFTSPIAHYFESCLENSSFDRERFEVLCNFFTNIQMNELQSATIITGYTALGAIVHRYKISVVLSHETNAEYMNYCISKHLTEEKKQQQEGQLEQREIKPVERVDAGKPLSADQILAFVQGMLMENEDTWANKLPLLKIVAKRFEMMYYRPRFRRWASFVLGNLDLETMQPRNFKELVMVSNRILGHGSQKFKFKIIKQAMKLVEGTRDNSFVVDLFQLFNSFGFLFRKQRPEDSIRHQSLFEKEVTQEDREEIQTCFAAIRDLILNDSLSFSIDDSMSLIRNLVKDFSTVELEVLKQKRLHKDLWDKMLRKNTLNSMTGDVFRTLNYYDLVKDQEMQKMLGEMLDKVEKSRGENDEGRKRTPRSVEEVYTRFYNEKGQLAGESLVILERLGKLVNKGEEERK